MSENQPREFDVVLGGNTPPPVTGVVLGGIEGVKRRLESEIVDVRVKALSDGLNYGNEGLDLVIQALEQNNKTIQRHAYKLLRRRQEKQVKQILEAYQPWYVFDRLSEHKVCKALRGEGFSNRQVVDYNPKIGITDPKNTAYKLRCNYDSRNSITEKLTNLLEDSQANKLEALIIGEWGEAYDNDSSEIIDTLVDVRNYLSNLKAIYIGDMDYDECEISWIRQSDISPILIAYPQLEILQVKGGDGLRFNEPLQHNNLRALIVETGGLSSDTVNQICNMNLPRLLHLDLWFGSYEYGGDCSISDIKPVVDDLIFPELNYLGLCNSEFSDDIAEAVVKSPLIETISILNLSLGTLGDKGGEFLLNCAAVNELDFLELTDNFLSEEMVNKLSALDCQLLARYQGKTDDEGEGRYCSVSE
ncbi:MAG: STM4015 family protein [Cyanobacteria bacterium P01_A01_bin.68]